MRAIAQLPKSNQAGFTILESLIAVVIVGLAMAASASMFMVALRGFQDTKQTYAVQAAIDKNKAEIDTLARNFTCCSGTCTTTPPTTFGTVSGVAQPCATNNPNDDRYYFPRLDLASTTTNFPYTTTPSEPNAVDQLCATSNNTNFMTPLKDAIDNVSKVPQPSPANRAPAVILSNKMLRVDFKGPNSNFVVRSLYIRPRMANFCS